ncbi:MAG: PBP1A family penicillin-binding protein, partial [Clostridia bacterium]|nr:PBP1A family penicillin-binding protein [Clostridia bacterium]
MSRSKRTKRKLNVNRIILIVVLTFAFIIGGAGLGFVAGALKNLPNIESGGLDEIAVSSYVFDKNGDLATTLHGVENRTLVTLDKISPHMKDALLAIEDQRFYKHPGIDPYRIAGAFVSNLKSGRIVAGGSTITQQLVGLAMLDRNEKTYTRKIQEAIIALKVENDYTKDELLEFYLNRVYFGHGAYGVEAASKKFFDKSAADLTIEEAALLAGVIQNPGRHSPINNPENALTRRAIVLNAMVDFNKLSKEEAEELKKTPLNLKEGKLEESKYKYQSFVDHVIEEAIEKLELTNQETSRIYTEGYRIYTTLDPDIQGEMDKIYSDPTKFPKGKGDKIIQSAMVVIETQNGEIRGLIGGRDQEGKRQFNRATQALRQPGSAIKPVAVFAPAVEKGYSPATVLDDYPKTYKTPGGDWTPKNYNNRYRGLVSMRTGIQHSINTVAVRMLDQIGITEGFRFLENLGITSLVESGSKNDMGLSLALGGLTKGVSVLELTGAYQAFSNQGVYIEPYAITKIEDRNGNVLYEHKVQKRVVMSPETAYLL